jgi:hypothetical protein
MNTHLLEGFVESENRWRAIFGSKSLSLLNTADHQTIADIIDSKLSPENLTCDGELSGSEVRTKYKYLTRLAEELQSINPSVQFYEA